MRPTTPRSRAVPGSRATVCAALAALCAVPACSSAYKESLREMAVPLDDRLAVRVHEMVERATHATESLDRVAQWYRTHDASAEATGPGSLRLARAEAEAAAFDTTRRVLSVGDAIAEMDPDDAQRTHPILDAANTVAASLDRAVLAMNEGNPTDPAWLGALEAATTEAEHAIAALRDHARAIATH